MEKAGIGRGVKKKNMSMVELEETCYDTLEMPAHTGRAPQFS